MRVEVRIWLSVTRGHQSRKSIITFHLQAAERVSTSTTYIHVVFRETLAVCKLPNQQMPNAYEMILYVYVRACLVIPLQNCFTTLLDDSSEFYRQTYRSKRAQEWEREQRNRAHCNVSIRFDMFLGRVSYLFPHPKPNAAYMEGPARGKKAPKKERDTVSAATPAVHCVSWIFTTVIE